MDFSFLEVTPPEGLFHARDPEVLFSLAKFSGQLEIGTCTPVWTHITCWNV